MELNTYLFFDGQCEEAFKLYETVLAGKIVALMRYKDVPSGPPEFAACERIIHVSLQVGASTLMGSDSPPPMKNSGMGDHPPEAHKPPQGFRACIGVDTPAEAERIYQALTQGGSVAMPIGETFFAHRFGMFADKFGTPWMITCPKDGTATRVETKPFVISRTFDAPRDRVWKAFTDPAEMQKWWGPKGVTIIASKMDLRPGGTYLYGMRPAIGPDMWGRMVYREIVPPERILFVNSFSDADGGLTRHPMAPTWPLEMLSTFEFTEHAGKTTFTVTWVPINEGPAERATFDAGHDSMKQGWTGTLDQLSAYLAKA